ncbi:site-specific integrase [Mycobacterium sp. 4858]|uniref:tyrosine-type recombinase/integrase n=1 Tax=Mycobacterium sp. 4858 TaxID=2057185 RepID=UPI000C82544B|nr:site-specific integrase [Mycobacterium sp. 4858]
MAYIRELPNGKFRILWRENAQDDYGSPIKGQYRQRSETVATAKEAERRKIDIEREIESGHDPSARRDKAVTPLGTYAARYFDAAAPTMGDATLVGYRKLYHRHIADAFGSRPIGSILPSDVSAWFSDLLAGDSNRYANSQDDSDERELAKRSPKTAKQALGVLRRICAVAVLDNAIMANPALVKLTTSSKRRASKFRHTPLTGSQIIALADHVANRGLPAYGLFVTFAGFTGLRASELAGLEIRDVVLTDSGGSVRVERAKTKRGGKWATEPLKTDESARTVPLEHWLAQDLRGYLANHPRADEPTAPLFPGRLDLAAAKAQGRNVKVSGERFDWSRPVDPSNFYKRFMQPGEAALGLPAARFHDLRHSFAVNLLSANPAVDFKRVSKWLGHSSFTLTLDVYGDYINDDVSQPAGLARPVAVQSNVVPLNRRNA